MPWKEASAMSLRLEFVLLAMQKGVCIRSLCRRFSISAPTAYKWITRYRKSGAKALADRTRRPKNSPSRTPENVEKAVLEIRAEHSWGGRKIHQRLLKLGHRDIPSPSTITEICRRNGFVDVKSTRPQRDLQRFEAPAPNLLWQIDFMGAFPLYQDRCFTLTVLDDHSRFSLNLSACANQQYETVRGHLQTTFRCYGLPYRILADNGGPWGSCGNDGYTQLAVWFIRLGISLSHSRVCHPQTLGKDERFHRTLQHELISRRSFSDLADCQNHYDRWRTVYNCERPHEALRLEVPASRYQPSLREFPESLPPIEYANTDIVRKVDPNGTISFHNRSFKIGRGLGGSPVAVRPTTTDGVFNVFFCHEQVDQIDLNNHLSSPNNV
jgi:transposase InsO family protein